MISEIVSLISLLNIESYVPALVISAKFIYVSVITAPSRVLTIDHHDIVVDSSVSTLSCTFFRLAPLKFASARYTEVKFAPSKFAYEKSANRQTALLRSAPLRSASL